MEMVRNIILPILIVSSIALTIFSFMILNYLREYGIKVNWWLARYYLLKYLNQYKTITTEKHGKPGNLYYAWLVTLGLTLISVIVLLVTVFIK